MYISEQTFELVVAIADVFLADIKFGCQCCADSIAGTPHYLENVLRNIKTAYDAGKRVIIRHLPLSGHFDCCTRPVLEWVAANCPQSPIGIISLLAPLGSDQKLPSKEEASRIDRIIADLGLTQVGYGITSGLPDVGVRTRTVESLLHIRKDGSVAVQDTPGEILEILKKISGQSL